MKKNLNKQAENPVIVDRTKSKLLADIVCGDSDHDPRIIHPQDWVSMILRSAKAVGGHLAQFKGMKNLNSETVTYGVPLWDQSSGFTCKQIMDSLDKSGWPEHLCPQTKVYQLVKLANSEFLPTKIIYALISTEGYLFLLSLFLNIDDKRCHLHNTRIHPLTADDIEKVMAVEPEFGKILLLRLSVLATECSEQYLKEALHAREIATVLSTHVKMFT